MPGKNRKRVASEGTEPDHVHTSKSGRKYMIADEVIHLPIFKDRLRRLRELTRKSSKLVSG